MTDALEQATQSRQQEHFKRALGEYQKIVAVDPQNALAFQGLGQTLLLLANYTEAITAFQRALELTPTLALSHAALGHIYLVRKQYTESEKELGKAIVLDPKLIEAQLDLGFLLAVQGKYTEGESIVIQVIQSDPKKSLPYCYLSDIYALQKRLDESTRTMWQAFQREPSMDTGRLLISAIMRQYGALAILPSIVIVLIASQGTSPINMIIISIFVGWALWVGINAFRSGKRKTGILMILSASTFVGVYVLKFI